MSEAGLAPASEYIPAGPKISRTAMFALKSGAVLLLLGCAFLAWTSEAGQRDVLRYRQWDGRLVAVGLALFLIGILLYVRTLQACLSLIRPKLRTLEPKGVWTMLLIPYNFIDDFFIIAAIAASLRRAAAGNPALLRSPLGGLASGWGWCLAQLISLFPGPLGEPAAIIGLLLWGMHWRYIHRCNAALRRQRGAWAT